MKMIYKWLAVVILAATLYSCKKQLDALPKNAKVESNTILDAGTAQIALNGAYFRFAAASQSRTGWQFHEIYPAEFAGYIGYGYGSFGREYENLNIGLSHYWQESYLLLNATNGVIGGVSALPDVKFTGNRKKEMIAEARFLRAYAHFKILTWFGEWYKPASPFGVLLRDELSTLSNISKQRSSVKESYDFIIADLDDAIANAPVKNAPVYATKWAAMALKMRVLISRGLTADYPMVVQLADNLLNSGPYQLASSAENLFRREGLSSKEVILGIQPQAQQELYAFSKSRQYWPGASALYVAVPRLKNLLANDPRQSWMLGSQRGSGTAETYFFTKYMAENGTPSIISETDYAIRLSEVYLLKAEAICRSGGSLANAKAVVHEVQAKAGITATANTAPYLAVENANTPELLLLEIFKETVKTLIAEDGMEWMALLRLPFDTVKQLKPTITSQTQYILPVPRDEFLYNPSFGDQNPGYEKF